MTLLPLRHCALSHLTCPRFIHPEDLVMERSLLDLSLSSLPGPGLKGGIVGGFRPASTLGPVIITHGDTHQTTLDISWLKFKRLTSANLLNIRLAVNLSMFRVLIFI